MKIAFFYGNLNRGGAQRVISVLADQFVKKGDEVILLTLDDGERGYELDERVRVTGLETASDSKNKFESAARLMRALKKMRSWEKREKPDVVVVFSTHLAFQMMLSLAFLDKRCKVIASERAHPGERAESLKKKFDERIFPLLDGFIFQTERVSRLFPQSLREKGTVIHNGLFSDDIPEKITAFPDRDSRKICAVGRLDIGQKAYDVMFKAFAIFHRNHPEHILNVYGRGSGEPELRALISELGLENSIILHGNHPHVINEIRDAGMFVMTSRYEGMPNALIEAMACGLPCVCTDCEFGPGELIRNEKSGLLVPVNDAEAIAAAMARIADDPTLAEQLSCGALEIRQTHSKEEICRQYHDYIENVVKG